MQHLLIVMALLQDTAPLPGLPIDSGTEVRVERVSARPVSGDLLRAWLPSDAALSVCLTRWCRTATERDAREVPSTDVRSVAVRSGNHSGRGALLGVLVGLTAGALFYESFKDSCSDCTTTAGAEVIPVFGVGTGLLGALIGAGVPRWRTVHPLPPAPH